MRELLLVFALMASVSCSNSSSGTSPTDNRPPLTQEKPQFEKEGPNGERLIVAQNPTLDENQITLLPGTATGLLAPAEKLVSAVVMISASKPLVGKGYSLLRLKIPNPVRPANLQAKIRLSTGVVVPFAGQYDATKKEYSLSLPMIFDKWSLAVVETANLQKISSQAQPFFQSISAPSIGTGWITEMDWQTCEWTAVNHTEMTVADIQAKILPDAVKSCEVLRQLGTRAPRLWIDPQTGGRVLHVVPVDSHFSFSPKELNTNFTMQNATENELQGLGQMYVSYAQFLTLNKDLGISLGNILIHELTHGVQRGYDLRQSDETVNAGTNKEAQYSSLKAYLEGTATPIGQTYQEQGAVLGPKVFARDLHEGEYMLLDSAIDNPYSSYYKKQSFFAFVALKYNQGSFAYVHPLFEQMAMDSYFKTLSVSEHLSVCRKSMDQVFQGLFAKSLTEIYFNFAEERALIHTPDLKLHKIDQTFKPWSVGKELFSEVLEMNLITGKNPVLTLEKIKPLSSRLVRFSFPGAETHLRVNFLGGDYASGKFKLIAYHEDAKTLQIDSASRAEVKSLSGSLYLKKAPDKDQNIIFLFMNGSSADELVQLTFSSGPLIKSIPLAASTGQSVLVSGEGFGSSKGLSQLQVNGQEVLPTSWSDTEIRFQVGEDWPSGKVSVLVLVNQIKSNVLQMQISQVQTEKKTVILSVDSQSSNASWPLEIPITLSLGRSSWKATREDSQNSVQYQMTIEGTADFNGEEILLSGVFTLNGLYQVGDRSKKHWDKVTFKDLRIHQSYGSWVGDAPKQVSGQFSRIEILPPNPPVNERGDYVPEVSFSKMK